MVLEGQTSFALRLNPTPNHAHANEDVFVSDTAKVNTELCTCEALSPLARRRAPHARGTPGLSPS
eukprot:6115885-Pyramimonas_sp.AAC.2